jgi:DNA-binding LytR/AlgR family response regulator
MIVDDEPLALDILENYIERAPSLELVQRCSNALQAYDYLQKEQVDLIFLDIHMPELTGIDLLKSLATRPEVIFTTAYPNYALEGFNLDVLDYLIKPIAFDRFLKAVNKASKVILKTDSTDSGSSSSSSSSSPNAQDFIYVKADLKMVKVRYSEILFVEGMKDYVKIQLEKGMLVTHQTMKYMEENLPGDRFMRIHRSYIVALDRIESIDGNLLDLGNHRVQVSANYKDKLLEYVKRHNL